ncbi:hypothetical protein SH580_16425 [Coraliomargarita algicola]|uniref:Uncharacterized protein n=1 Tax=Coraliomargarita algicola TaxID=3092156 RepID=A0ABZ0RJS3_9BACT|nr:hypothetical protein [Coraliomargarita sp. J2-16]WPJ95015.1 hypothetical protein SH580_16425 [Coraliomargarita sp. J2-16]
MSIPTGRYVTHATMFSILMQMQPQQLPIQTGMTANVDSGFLDLVNEVVWSVVPPVSPYRVPISSGSEFYKAVSVPLD